jgi:hypothetical protein
MKRPSTISQNVRIFVAATALAVGAAACGGGSGDSTGGAGSGGTGTAGTNGTACSLDDVNKIFVSPPGSAVAGCTITGTCHDANGSGGGFSMLAPSWQNNLVGKGPVPSPATATFPSMCANMNLMFLNANSKPATGLFLDKINPAINPPCGLAMPELQPRLTSAQFACIQSWANTLTAN